MIRALLILALLSFLLWSLRWLIQTPPQKRIAMTRSRGSWLVVALVLAVLLAHSWLLLVLGVIGVGIVRGLPHLLRWWPQLARVWHQPVGGFGRRPAAMPKSVAEAYAVLGLKPGATRAEIIAAHRRLMHKVHPDRGGSDFLAAQINRAKEILLNSHK